MRRFSCPAFFPMAVFFLVQAAACSKPAPENPFNYPFIKQLHLKRQTGKPYSDYKAFYVLSEDFEPLVESPYELESARDVLKFASGLTAKYKIERP
jgi:hypothetical protein